MKKLTDKLDPKYTKICLYAGATVVLTAAALFVLYYSGGFWTTLWSMFTAVLRPLVIGGIICYLMLPIVNKLEKRFESAGKFARIIAIAICYLAIFAILGALFVAIFLALNKGIQSIDLKSLQSFWVSSLNTLRDDFDSLLASLEQQLSTKLTDFPVEKVTGVINSIVGGITGLFSSIIFGIVFSVYIMLDLDNIISYWQRAVRIVFGEKVYGKLGEITLDADMVFSGYIRGQFIDALILGVGCSIVFLIAGIPYAVIVGIVVGVGNLIPYVGPVAGYAALAVVCLIDGSFSKFVLGAAILMVVMFLDGHILNPKLLSDTVKVHPLLVIVALIGGGAIGGFLGMIIAVPVAALIKLQFDKYLAAKEDPA